MMRRLATPQEALERPMLVVADDPDERTGGEKLPADGGFVMTRKAASASSMPSRPAIDLIARINAVIRNPETGKPFELLRAEIAFLAHAFTLDEEGRAVYPWSTARRKSPAKPASLRS